jgi:prepilin-type N-terminal cleavage/methylation domain-containing protein
MKKNFTDKQSAAAGQKGFSLIEMVVVVVIMAVLAAVAIPIYKNNQIDAYAPEAEAVLYAYTMAAQRYRAYNGNSFIDMTMNDLKGPPYNVVETTTNWTFSLTVSDADNFTVTATGNAAQVADLSGRTIKIIYNAAATPNETKTYSW